MSTAATQHDDVRLHELLADRATLGLTVAESLELESLIAGRTDVDADEFDRVAATLDLAWSPARFEPLPTALRATVAAQAAQALPIAIAAREERKSAAPQPVAPVELAKPKRSAFNVFEWGGWLAAAASLLLLLNAWREFGGKRDLAPAEARQALLNKADVITSNWSALDPAAAPTTQGDVVWSPSAQAGFLRIRGLAANDPRTTQYQLWIFDKNQDERYPIDGGVFDIDPTSGEVVIPIRAKLKVVDPAMFAITAEKAGGVVVSDRSKLLLIAKVEPSG